MKKTVLVFPCGTEIGLELYESLRYSAHFDLIGASSVADHGRFVYQNYVEGLPLVGSQEFLSALNKVIDQMKVDFIFPAHDSVVLALAEASETANLHCRLITSPAETCIVARSKSLTYQRLRGVVPVPKEYRAIEEITARNYPVFLKPDAGQGSKGTHVAYDQRDVEFYASKDETVLILEYLPGREYTVDCFTDKNGKLRFAEARERKRIINGISVSSATVQDTRFQQIAKKINKALTFRGVWFFQLKERGNGDLVLMEIAPRVAGTMGLVRCKGVNLALLSLFDAMDYAISIFENHCGIVIDRALQNSYQHDIEYDHVYLDFDDLVVFKGRVNPAVIAFVYQCFNTGRTVHLVTKHTGNLNETLQKYRLQGMFDSVIHLKKDDEKYSCMLEKKAIFVDDSYAERQQVSQRLGIPVFDAHALEGLMEKY